MIQLSFRSILTESEEETQALGALLAEHLAPGVTVLLEGELGAGKTTLVRGYCAAIGCENVRSPSFTLVNLYKGDKSQSIVHSDLYRLDRCDVDELELEEYADEGAVVFVEWADRGYEGTSPSITIRFSYGDEKNGFLQRRIDFFAVGDGVEKMLDELFTRIEKGGFS
ncbi:MAG: tRNA (adenosine(37)-N6)-threonylcarbamoyltransferase complex ATPase subunit type 1 TsaE [Synergistaceae bacterium]|nr:tRNA (adenosine(37)-N6)-threonylcarbamoyltransferase complex ATPase subunit type 1 TsaE [Synergistaceae bacterium]